MHNLLRINRNYHQKARKRKFGQVYALFLEHFFTDGIRIDKKEEIIFFNFHKENEGLQS